MRLTPEQKASLIQDRQSGMTREALAVKYNMKLGGIKSFLKRAGVVLPMEQRQSNALGSKLLKNPNALADMRKSLTADVVKRRSASIATRYATDPALRELKGRQSRDWWTNNGPESKYTWQDVIAAIEPLGLKPTSILTGHMDSDSVEIRCHCGVVWVARAFDLLYGKVHSCGCVKSQPQAELTSWIQGLGFDAEPNNRLIIKPFELDIVVESKKLAIEYCGLAWHGENRKESRRYHVDKLEAAEAAGYRLITIFADEWLMHKEAVQAYLGSILGVAMDRTGARETDVVQVQWDEAKPFLDRWHIQGAGAPLETVVGLRKNGELLVLASFKPTNMHRRGRADDGVWELVRYCVRGGVAIPGAFDKLLSAFKTKFLPKLLFTYSDRRWSQGGIYAKSGFTKTSTNGPSYWYFKKNTDFPRFHKSKFRKSSIGAQSNETEWEVMQRLGYDRIWDCGICKWTLSVDRS